MRSRRKGVDLDDWTIAGGIGVGIGDHMNKKKVSKQVREGLVERARAMRSELTDEEAILWRALRRRQLGGFKFRRQHIIGAYIVDFYCPEEKLVIEVDGPVHEIQKEYDRQRDDELFAMGYRIMHFRNKEILDELDTVLKKILEVLRA
jgi:very-short-patch-repair endonuclease